MKGDTGTRPARLLLVDDHELVRDGFHRMLGPEPGLEVIGEASNGQMAVDLCRRLKPDLVLMDVRMPEMDGLEATRAIKRDQPEISVLIVTTYVDPGYLLEALKAGAAGYVLKDAPKSQLINSVRRVIEGESPLNQELAKQLIQHLASETDQSTNTQRTQISATAASQPAENLTPRELEVLGLLAQGQTNPDIARTLVISRGTAKVHVERIIRKLGVSDRTQAVVRAIERGLIRPTIER